MELFSIRIRRTFQLVSTYLTPIHPPLAYKNKIECLKQAGHSEKEARQLALEPIELELYCETGMAYLPFPDKGQ